MTVILVDSYNKEISSFLSSKPEEFRDMGHGHDHHDPYKIPDWRKYKVEDIPELMTTKRALASHGLSDPWLRNEVWRYDPKIWGTYQSRFRALFFKGFYVGCAATAITLAGTYIYDQIYPSEHHGHGHHGKEH